MRWKFSDEIFAEHFQLERVEWKGSSAGESLAFVQFPALQAQEQRPPDEPPGEPRRSPVKEPPPRPSERPRRQPPPPAKEPPVDDPSLPDPVEEPPGKRRKPQKPPMRV